MADNRIVVANLRLSRRIKTASIYQHCYGQILKIVGVDLPDTYEVHFKRNDGSDTAFTMLGNADGVQIHDSLLETSNPIHAWIFLHDTDSDGETVYEIEIPVIPRPKTTDAEPTPVQQDVITQAIAALNEGVTTVEAALKNYLIEVEAGTNCLLIDDWTGAGKRSWLIDVEDGTNILTIDEPVTA